MEKSSQEILKILIVDDAKLMRNMIKNTLQSHHVHCTILEAADGETAVNIVKQEKPQLITMDITMEGKDGLEAVKEIMNLDQAAKIIMVTSMGQEIMLKECIRAGAMEYIMKPFTEERLMSAINSALE